MWNIATATTDGSGVVLYDSEAPTDVDIVFQLASTELAEAAAASKPVVIRIELTGITEYGMFTASDAQTLAVRLLDGLCDALSE